MLEKQIDFEGVPLFYAVTGSGNAVILLHGFGEDGSVWQQQVEALVGYKIVVPSLPGTGKSGLSAKISMEGLAGAVKQIVEAEGLTSVVMLGHSMGGYVALAYAASYPGDLSGFGLIHSTAYADTQEKKETRRKGMTFILKNGGPQFLKTSIPNLYAPNTREEAPQLIQQHVESANNFCDAALVAYYRSMMERRDRTDVLKSSSVPVLFVAGRWDEAVPLNDVLKQTSLPELSYIHILKYSGHMGMIEEAEKMNKAIKDFTDHCFKQRFK